MNLRKVFRLGRGAIFNFLFAGSYFLLRPFVGDDVDLPFWLTITLLVAFLLEHWALYYKVTAVQYRVSLLKDKVPSIFFSFFYSIIRVVLFTFIFDMILRSWGLEYIENYTDIALVFLLVREFFTYYLMNKTPERKSLKEPSHYWEGFADLTLLFIMQFCFLVMVQLFNDLGTAQAAPWYTMVLLATLLTFLFLIFYMPFRAVYVYEEIQMKDTSVPYILSVVIILVIFLAPIMKVAPEAL